VVKVSDKIAFLGRDIEDAFSLHFFTPDEFASRAKKFAPGLDALLNKTSRISTVNISNTALINGFIMDLISSSSPQTGLSFSADYLALMEQLRTISNKLIYEHPRLNYFKKLARLILESLFIELDTLFSGPEVLFETEKRRYYAPRLYEAFEDWLIKYTTIDQDKRELRKYKNRIIYDLDNQSDRLRCIVEFLSGMTDNFAIEAFEELTKFR
jgi:dGTPase